MRLRVTPRALAAPLVASALMAAACSGAARPAAAPTTTPAATTPPTAGAAAASGCTAPAAAGTSTLQLQVTGHSRVVIVHAPSSGQPSRPRALVLDLHGSGSTAAQQEAVSGMDAAANADGFIVAYPQGLIASSLGFDWNVPNATLVGGGAVPAGAADDVAFLTGLVAALGARYCIDAAHVYATGLSGGGRMASALGCDAPTVFAGIAPVAGLRFPSPCPSSKPVPVVAFHGTADPVDPYTGNGQAYWTYSVPVAAARWAAHDGCAPTPATVAGTGYTITRYSGCAAGTTVELYTLTGEGHEWPGGPKLPRAVTRLLGPQSNAVDADAVIWSTLHQFQLP